MPIPVIPCTDSHLPALAAHFERLRAESGANGIHFMPFAPGSVEAPKGPDHLKLHLPLDTPGWERCLVATDPDDPARIIGHADLKGGRLLTEIHRCTLGIGIEASYCGIGLGTQLMERLIQFARSAESLAWIELGVFHKNLPARGLYRKFGFVEVGTVEDKFRIADSSINDVIMVLRL